MSKLVFENIDVFVDDIISRYITIKNGKKTIDLIEVLSFIDDDKEFEKFMSYILDPMNGYTDVVLENYEIIGYDPEEAFLDCERLSANSYINEALGYDKFTKSEEVEAFLKLNSYDKDSEEYKNQVKKIAEAYLEVVIRAARKYKEYDTDYSDIIQIGNLALMKSIETYDVHQGVNFSPYAYHTIRLDITRAIIKNKSYVNFTFGGLHKVFEYNRQKEELVNNKSSFKYDDMVKEYGYTEEEVKEFEKMSLYFDLISLEQFLDAEKETLEAYAEDAYEECNCITSCEQRCDIERAVSLALKEIEDSRQNGERLVDIIMENYGKGVSFREIANKYGVSRQRVEKQAKQARIDLEKNRNLQDAYRNYYGEPEKPQPKGKRKNRI